MKELATHSLQIGREFTDHARYSILLLEFVIRE